MKTVEHYGLILCSNGEALLPSGDPAPLYLDSSGYLQVKIDGHFHRLHRLLAKLFNLPGRSKEVNTIRHINHCKLDNHIDNLLWLSARDNSIESSNWNKGRCVKWLTRAEMTAIKLGIQPHHIHLQTRTPLHILFSYAAVHCPQGVVDLETPRRVLRHHVDTIYAENRIRHPL